MQKTMLDKLKEELRAEGVEPAWMAAEPFCSNLCTQNRFGYCALLNGNDPCIHCGAAVGAMSKTLAGFSLLGAVDAHRVPDPDCDLSALDGSLSAASQQAARDYAKALDHCIGDVLQAAGLWNGKDETKTASVRAAAGRMVLRSNADDPTTLILLDGLPVGKVRWEVVSAEPAEQLPPAK